MTENVIEKQRRVEDMKKKIRDAMELREGELVRGRVLMRKIGKIWG